ncbi:molybdopterin molybdotransferase MoeA [Chryseobacterium sp. JJR-5R]|uniref:molybdopterin molybdotransferase MoeA n=1 Tax=Chryseobacterium sp. JJR-5R TaxID=3093923 RepID=UPI002A75C8D8|nr:gephyrin-like molybdotransferase Glp [Chryseobacterium sp. JJR-5R]WPO81555.1 molybdopterin molybdotransferase MoeA [Chryseobacterium sp. JJR-5R]
MISVHEAQQIILQNAPTKKTALIPLSEAAGLVVSSDIPAHTDIPAFSQSSMDGYALKFEDRRQPLTIKGEMAAGTSQPLAIETGEATRIFTGAPLPEGADTVVMQEKINIENGRLLISDEGLSLGLNVRPKGSEVKKGETAMAAGTYLSPAAIGFLAGIGHDRIEVFVPPVIAIIVTGNELQDPGRDLAFGQVYEANSFQLKAALQKTGITDIHVFTADDHPEELMDVLQKALAMSDVVLLNGGVSVGDYDFVASTAEQCGVIQKFHKIKQKPGKPLFFGIKGEKLIFGLPGNPSSSLTCFYEYVLPALENATGLRNSVKKKEAVAAHDYKKPAGLTHFLKAYYDEERGEVSPLYAQESYRLHSFAQANCFIVLPEESAGCLKGDKVEIHLLPV